MLFTMPKSRRIRRKPNLTRRLEEFNMREQDRYHVQERVTLAELAGAFLGAIITVGGFYALTVIIFTL